MRLMDLASPIFLFVASFLRKAERGVPLSYEEVRKEVLNLLKEQDEKSGADPELAALWEKAKRPLVYLIDETMVLNGAWDQENKIRWENETLETTWLGESQQLRGVRFFDECDEEQRAFKTAERVGRHDLSSQAELLEIFYIFNHRFTASPGRHYHRR